MMKNQLDGRKSLLSEKYIKYTSVDTLSLHQEKVKFPESATVYFSWLQQPHERAHTVCVTRHHFELDLYSVRTTCDHELVQTHSSTEYKASPKTGSGHEEGSSLPFKRTEQR